MKENKRKENVEREQSQEYHKTVKKERPRQCNSNTPGDW